MNIKFNKFCRIYYKETIMKIKLKININNSKLKLFKIKIFSKM